MQCKLQHVFDIFLTILHGIRINTELDLMEFSVLYLISVCVILFLDLMNRICCDPSIME